MFNSAATTAVRPIYNKRQPASMNKKKEKKPQDVERQLVEGTARLKHKKRRHNEKERNDVRKGER